jgi:hypothetical protein
MIQDYKVLVFFVSLFFIFEEILSLILFKSISENIMFQIIFVCSIFWFFFFYHTLLFLDFPLVFLQVVILDVRVPCTPVARLNNHRACVNGIAWAPHSSCHICTAGKHGRERIMVVARKSATTGSLGM